MSRLLPLGLALAAALLLTACGGSNTKLIPEDRAQELKDTVDQVAAARRATRTARGAESALRRARNQVSELPRSVDAGLKDNLNEWLDQVASRIADDCKPAETPTPTAPTETPTETPTRDADRDADGDPDRDADGDPDRHPDRRPSTVPTVEPPDSGGVDPGDEDDG